MERQGRHASREAYVPLTRCTRLPSAFMTNVPPADDVENAICRPSGDQIGGAQIPTQQAER